MLSEGLDGAQPVMLDQLTEASVRLTVSRYHKLSRRVLGDDEMAAPVAAPLFGGRERERRGKTVEPGETNEKVGKGKTVFMGLSLTCRTGCSRWLGH